MVVTRITFDFFQTSSNGRIARLVRTETLDVCGVHKEDVLVQSEDEIGATFANVKEAFGYMLLLEMGMTQDELNEYDYSTVSAHEYEQPDEDDEDEEQDEGDELEDEQDEDEDEDGDVITLQIDRKTGKARVI